MCETTKEIERSPALQRKLLDVHKRVERMVVILRELIKEGDPDARLQHHG